MPHVRDVFIQNGELSAIRDPVFRIYRYTIFFAPCTALSSQHPLAVAHRHTRTHSHRSEI